MKTDSFLNLSKDDLRLPFAHVSPEGPVQQSTQVNVFKKLSRDRSILFQLYCVQRKIAQSKSFY